MKIRALLFICCTTILVSAVEAKIKEDEGAPKQIVHIEKMDKRVSELMADRVNIRKNMELKELATLSVKITVVIEILKVHSLRLRLLHRRP